MLSESEPTSAIPLRMESNGMAYLRGLGGRFPATSSEFVWRWLRNRVSAGGDVGRGSLPGPRDPTLPPPARELRTALSVWGEFSLGEAAVFLWNFFFKRVLKAAASFVSCFCRVALRARSAGAGSKRRCRVEDGEWAGLAPHAQGFLRESSSRRLRFLRVRRFASAPWNEACFRRTTLVLIERCLCRTSGGGTV